MILNMSDMNEVTVAITQMSHDSNDSTFVPAVGCTPGHFLIDGLVTAMAVYIIVMQWVYCYRKLRRRSTHRNMKMFVEAVLLSIAALLTLGVVIFRIILYKTDSIARFSFGMIKSLIILFYAISLMVCYSISWLRQRTIYLNPVLFHLSNKISRFVSRYFIVYIIATELTLLVIMILTTFFNICTFEVYVNLMLASLVVWPLSVQLPIMSLMIIPLYKHHTTNLVTNQKYVTLMKRVTILTAVCALSDLTTAVVLRYVMPSAVIASEVNMIVNLVCITLISMKWREKFLPCRRNSNREDTFELQESQEASYCDRSISQISNQQRLECR